jgi:hypothetical protein
MIRVACGNWFGQPMSMDIAGEGACGWRCDTWTGWLLGGDLWVIWTIAVVLDCSEMVMDLIRCGLWMLVDVYSLRVGYLASLLLGLRLIRLFPSGQWRGTGVLVRAVCEKENECV